MARRSDHSKDELQDLIVESAARNVAQYGYGGISARQIAADIGYTVGTLYHNFKNLDEIVYHVNARTLDDLYARLRHACEREADPWVRPLALGRAYIEFALAHRQRWRAIYDIPVSKEKPAPPWYYARVARNLEYVAAQIAPLVQGGNPRVLRKAAYSIWCGVHGILVLSINHKLDVPRAEIGTLASSLIENYLAGLVARGITRQATEGLAVS